jgi:hypothetical protein
MTTFLGVQGYAVLNNEPVVLRDSFTDADGTETARWEFEKQSWIVRAAMGVRFRWLPD